MSYVVISGTPSDGFDIIGPFEHPSYASQWAETWEEDIDYWVAELIAPATREVNQPHN